MRILRHLWIVVLVGGLGSAEVRGEARNESANRAANNLALPGAEKADADGREEERKAKEERDKEKDAQARQDQGAAQEHRKKAEEHEERARKHFEQAKALRDNAAQNQQAGDAASTQDAGKGSSQASGQGGEKGGGEGGAPPQMPSPQQSQQGNDSQGNEQAQNQPQPRQPEPQKTDQTAQNQPQQDTVTQKQMEEMRTELDSIKAKEASLMERASQAAKPFQDIAQAATENYIRTLPGGDAAMDSFNKTYETLTPSKAGGLSSLKNRVANRIAERSWNNSSAPKYLGEWRNSVFQRSVASGSKAWQTWRTSWYGK